jgi:hypothetical protein
MKEVILVESNKVWRAYCENRTKLFRGETLQLAAFGTEEEVVYKVGLAEKGDDIFFLINNERRKVESLMQMNDQAEEIYEDCRGFLEEEDVEESFYDDIYYCTNPDCPTGGGFVRYPIKGFSKGFFCPDCGEELSVGYEDLTEDRLLTITHKLVEAVIDLEANEVIEEYDSIQDYLAAKYGISETDYEEIAGVIS